MRKLTNEEFIEKAITIHGNKYNYSKTTYINHKTKVCIICPKHGEFYQTPNSHLLGKGCPMCVGRNKTTESFINECKLIYGDMYNYSKIKYTGIHKPICVICPEHGEFYPMATNFLSGHSCPKCNHRSYKLTIKELIEKFKYIHGNYYDYSNIEYINRQTPIKIICPEHGEFYQKPSNHMVGKGCPKCNFSHLEREIFNNFKNIGIETQKEFHWLKNKRKMKLDFYIPTKNIAIECQGIQHFIDEWYKTKNNIIFRDELKYKLCKENCVKLIYYFPEKFLQYDKTNFYKDKTCFHNIETLSNYLNI